MGLRKELKGKKFKKLTVIEEDPNRDKWGAIYWKCQCDCGNICIVVGKSLTKGKTGSCGCLAIERARERSGENHPSWNGGVSTKGSLAWANGVISNLKGAAKRHGKGNLDKNIIAEDIVNLYESSNKLCAICGNPETSKKRHSIDHDHKTGLLRGVLCGNCNTAIGLLKEDPILFEKAIRYLQLIPIENFN